MYIGIDITTQNQSMEIMQDYATLTRTEGQLHSLCKIRRCLCAPHKKCWDEVQYMKIWSQETNSQSENKNVIGIMKDELGGRIIKKFVSLRRNMHS